MMMGKNNGAIARIVAVIIVPLMMLPNRRIDSEIVRVTSPMRLKGSMSADGCKYDFKYPRSPRAATPKTGTAANTHRASALVVDAEPVGGRKPGTITSTLEVTMNRK